MAGKRVGVYMQEATLERFRGLTKAFNLSQGELIGACCATLSYDEWRAVLDRYSRLQAMEAELQMTATKEVVDLLRGKSPEQISQVMQEVRERLAKNAAEPAK